eukprot:jgi/Chrzof1/10832/Cz05g13230.t1
MHRGCATTNSPQTWRRVLIGRSNGYGPVRRVNRLTCKCSIATGATPTELEALAAYTSSHQGGRDACLSVLKEAATHKTVPPQIVEGALLYLEQNTTTGRNLHVKQMCTQLNISE